MNWSKILLNNKNKILLKNNNYAIILIIKQTIKLYCLKIIIDLLKLNENKAEK